MHKEGVNIVPFPVQNNSHTAKKVMYLCDIPLVTLLFNLVDCLKYGEDCINKNGPLLKVDTQSHTWLY